MQQVGWAEERSDVPNEMHRNVGHATLCPTYPLTYKERFSRNMLTGRVCRG